MLIHANGNVACFLQVIKYSYGNSIMVNGNMITINKSGLYPPNLTPYTCLCKSNLSQKKK